MPIGIEQNITLLSQALTGRTVVQVSQSKACLSNLTIRLDNGTEIDLYPDSEDYDGNQGEYLKAIVRKTQGGRPGTTTFLHFPSEAEET